MKKKTVNLKKLAINKSAIASLSDVQQTMALGGADTLVGGTSPCGPCDYTQDRNTCLCLTQNCPSVNICPATVGYGCVPTARTVCVVC